ncbi:MAG: peptidoglycan-binding protein, partial [Clostridia bacterium]|nr:peptidoglycan-binding protein [Clostridia bacterium]
MLIVGAAADASPSVTPPPADTETTARPTAQVIVLPTAIPTLSPTLVPTQEPSPTPTAYTTLYVGDRGEEVKKLQRRLSELGYLTDRIDGIYGQNTKRAVERFQFYNDLTVDGIAGKATQRELYENPRVVTAPPDITPGPPPTPTATPVRTVTVPVYYVDQNGVLLSQSSVSCSAGTTTIYA